MGVGGVVVEIIIVVVVVVVVIVGVGLVGVVWSSRSSGRCGGEEEE